MEKKFAATRRTLFEKSESGTGFQPVFRSLTGEAYATYSARVLPASRLSDSPGFHAR